MRFCKQIIASILLSSGIHHGMHRSMNESLRITAYKICIKSNKAEELISSIHPLAHNSVLSDERIIQTNPFCRYVKNCLKQEDKNELLRALLVNAGLSYKVWRTACACALYIGANPDIKQYKHDGIVGECGDTVLLKAVKAEDESLIQYALSKKADPNNENVLFTVKNLRIAKILVNKGARIDIKNEFNASLLHYCTEHDIPVELLAYYINTGKLNCNIRDIWGDTPLHKLGDFIICAGSITDMIVKKAQLLLQAGARLSIQNERGETPAIICSKLKERYHKKNRVYAVTIQ